MGTIAFRNADQLVLWKLELLGQISDGMWENSRPHDHWRVWHSNEAIVDQENLGKNFYAQRESYNFNSKDLLDVVEKRMIGAVRLARVLGLERISQPDLRWCIGDDGKLMKHKQEKMGCEDARTVVLALEAETYTRKDLIRDLKDMKQIIKMRRK